MKLMSSKAYFLLFLFSLPVWWNLARPGFPTTDDGDWMLIRFTAFHQELKNGQFPVRWLNRLNNGYGYPVVTFLYPGFLYLAEVPKVLGFGFIDSIKILIVGCFLIGAYITYHHLSKLFNRNIAFFASLYYLYQPYLLWDLYKRGSVGELLALAVIPFLWWAIRNERFIASSIGFGMLIVAHNSLAVMFVPMLLVYSLLNNKKGFIKPFVYFLFGMGLSAFFSLPAIAELGNTQFRQTTVSNWQEYFINLKNLHLVAWNVVTLLVATYFMIKNKKRELTIGYLLIMSLFSLFLATPFSYFLWKITPLGSLVQFPFRFLAILAFTTPYLAAYIISNIKDKLQLAVAAPLFIILIFNSFSYILPQKLSHKTDAYFATNEATTTVADEYMPKWVKEKPIARSFQRIERIDDETVQINSIYWPGWKVFVDGEEKEIDYSNQRGLMRVKVPVGEHEIKPVFTETPLRLFADFISLISLLCLGFIFYRLRYNRVRLDIIKK